MVSRISVALLAIALLALAGLQYHWIGQISVAERQRLEQSVKDSSNRFSGDYATEVRSLANALDIRNGGEPDVSTLVARYHGWAEAAAYPDLLKTMYVVRLDSSKKMHLLQVNVQETKLDATEWPEKWEGLQSVLQHDPFVLERRINSAALEVPKTKGASAMLIQFGGGRPPDGQRGRGQGGGQGGGQGSVQANAQTPGFGFPQGFPYGQGRGGLQGFGRFGPPPQRAPEPPPRGNPPRRGDSESGRAGPPPPPPPQRAPELPSQASSLPAQQSQQQSPQQQPQQNPPQAWLLVELDDSAITKQIFPALFARDFPMTGDADYRIAVVSKAIPLFTIFSTGEAWSEKDLASPDYAVDLGPYGPGGPGGGRGGPGPGPGQRGGPFQPAFIGDGLRLLTKHEAGSLEIAVSNLRRKNLAISFGILMVLALGAGVVIVSGQRARTLGKLQMEFAAGVSHELRTPLAVIQSAAHNLRSGVVKDREGIEEYATIVQKEARRLSTMVEQVMTYAETQSGRKRYDIGPVDLNEVVDRALQHMAIPLSDAKATVENRMDPALPPAAADEVALTQCVQNLLSNAVKYGSGANSVQVEIESAVDRDAGKISISVIDHGTGVPPGDERHLFDPFHRGVNAATNTPGNGLGLHLVRTIMESQKGTVSYRRAEQGGACFTLTLPLGDTAV